MGVLFPDILDSESIYKEGEFSRPGLVVPEDRYPAGGEVAEWLQGFDEVLVG